MRLEKKQAEVMRSKYGVSIRKRFLIFLEKDWARWWAGCQSPETCALAAVE